MNIIFRIHNHFLLNRDTTESVKLHPNLHLIFKIYELFIELYSNLSIQCTAILAQRQVEQRVYQLNRPPLQFIHDYCCSALRSRRLWRPLRHANWYNKIFDVYKLSKLVWLKGRFSYVLINMKIAYRAFIWNL